jgi:hypothetical protein
MGGTPPHPNHIKAFVQKLLSYVVAFDVLCGSFSMLLFIKKTATFMSQECLPSLG